MTGKLFLFESEFTDKISDHDEIESYIEIHNHTVSVDYISKPNHVYIPNHCNVYIEYVRRTSVLRYTLYSWNFSIGNGTKLLSTESFNEDMKIFLNEILDLNINTDETIRRDTFTKCMKLADKISHMMLEMKVLFDEIDSSRVKLLTSRNANN